MLRKKIDDTHSRNIENQIPLKERTLNEVMAFRVFCQGVCIEHACNEFVENNDKIMNGEYIGVLLDRETIKEMIAVVRDICIEYAYRNNEVLSLELIGKSVLTSLLDKFIHAVSDEKSYNKPRHENGKLYRLISDNFKYVQKLDNMSKYIETKELNEHERVQLVIDYISCMTDSYALNLHKTLLGMRLP